MSKIDGLRGSAILTLTMKEQARLSFSSYDRMFPNQDTMPKGGFGNLIALPLQAEAARRGGSLFVDKNLLPYADQWIFLSGTARLSREQLTGILASLNTTPLGALRPVDDEAGNRPWDRKDTELQPGDIPPSIRITLADRLYIPIEGFSSRAQNHLRRIAAFGNPQFYRNQAMRMVRFGIHHRGGHRQMI